MSSNIRLDTNECTQMPVHTTFSPVKLIFVAWIFKSHRTILVMIGVMSPCDMMVGVTDSSSLYGLQKEFGDKLT